MKAPGRGRLHGRVHGQAAVLERRAIRTHEISVRHHLVELIVPDAMLALDHAVDVDAPLAAVLACDVGRNLQRRDVAVVGLLDPIQGHLGPRLQGSDRLAGQRVEPDRALFSARDRDDLHRLARRIVHLVGIELERRIRAPRSGMLAVKRRGRFVLHVLGQRLRPKRVLDPRVHVVQRVARHLRFALVERDAIHRRLVRARCARIGELHVGRSGRRTLGQRRELGLLLRGSLRDRYGLRLERRLRSRPRGEDQDERRHGGKQGHPEARS